MDRLVDAALKLSGLIVLAIGLAHFAMPSLGYSPDVIAAVPEAQREHFVYLGTYAIGTFLVSFGVMTLLVDRTETAGLHRSFLILMVLVWAARILLELVYPVTFSLFFLAQPHPVLMGALVVILVGYAVPLAAALRGSLSTASVE